MWGHIHTIEKLLESKRYNEALKFTKSKIETLIKEGREKEIISAIRTKKLLLNMSGDLNRTFLFCDKLIKFCLELNLDIKVYAEQCQLLNHELDWSGERYKLLSNDLHSLDPFSALHVILNVFENINHEILGAEPNKIERLYYTHYVYGMESEFESSVNALNKILKLWINGYQSGLFKGKFKGDFSLEKPILELQKQLSPIVRSTNFLEWICKQVTLYQVTLEEAESLVTFTIQDKEEYYRYKLPYIRDTHHMHSFFLNSLHVKGEFDQKINDIDYSRIVKIKESGDDFRLEFTSDILLNELIQSMKVAYQNNLLMIQDTYITNMNELKITNKSITVFEAFIFYHCLRAFALIYFDATKYFINHKKKKPRAPFLVLKYNDIYNHFIPILTKTFGRRLKKEEVNELISLFTFGTNNIYDLYYKPLIVFDDVIIINPSIYLMNNFAKTFLNHMKTLGVNLAERGNNFEVVVRKLFTNQGFIVYQKQYPFSYKHQNEIINGDIDLIARKGDYIYVAQLKNRLEPLEPQDYRGANKKINEGVKQSHNTLLYIERNVDEFCEKLGIKREDFNNLKIQPFVLVSCFYGSGQIIEEIPVIDMSALVRFLDEGQIRAYPPDGQEPFVQDLRTAGDVIPEEFNEFIKNPYFLKNNIYGTQLATQHAFHIRGRKFILRPNEDWQEQLTQNFITKAISYFTQKGII
ncbi:hypothetical protein [Bacillus toyonensis]|uniref:hypothetical protein n=1 Tax=Bacillus toyonensis TaxID=155322 RepID=UPI002379B686|nr:hypothetical protein [Bacillus toyonensis]MDD9265044.1 hypothetical protein [Bacillus toyonensis]